MFPAPYFTVVLFLPSFCIINSVFGPALVADTYYCKRSGTLVSKRLLDPRSQSSENFIILLA